MAFIANNGLPAYDDPDGVYTSEEDDYFSEDEEVLMDDDGPPEMDLPVSPYNRRAGPAMHDLFQIAERRSRRSA